jgi:DNA-directed RNA polymerase subunit beta'
VVPPLGWVAPEGAEEGDPLLLDTTLGRALLNEALPVDYPYVNDVVDKRRLSAIVNDLAERYPKVEVAATLDALKDTGFHWATRSGVTISISDVVTPPSKAAIMESYEGRAEKVQSQYEKGLITDDERRQELIEIWTQATKKIGEEMEDNFVQSIGNPIWMMVHSGARGNMMQVRQIAGMRGLSPTPRVRSSRGRSSRTSARVCRCWSTSSPRTAPGRGWRTPRCGQQTPATSPVVWWTSPRTSSSARRTVAPTGA